MKEEGGEEGIYIYVVESLERKEEVVGWLVSYPCSIVKQSVHLGPVSDLHFKHDVIYR